MHPLFNHCIILAAGEGRRMRPFTEHTPKPMAQVGNETLIKRSIRQCKEAGIEHIYMNCWYLADQLVDHVRDAQIHIVREDHLLETGGGIKNIIDKFNISDPLYCISGDSWWEDGATSLYTQIDKVWDDETDLVLGLIKSGTMIVTSGSKDYHFTNCRIQRAKNQDGDYTFTSHRLLHPRLFDGGPNGAFSFLELMDKAENKGTLKAVELDGVWHHLTDINDIDAVNAWLLRKAA